MTLKEVVEMPKRKKMAKRKKKRAAKKAKRAVKKAAKRAKRKGAKRKKRAAKKGRRAIGWAKVAKLAEDALVSLEANNLDDVHVHLEAIRDAAAAGGEE